MGIFVIFMVAAICFVSGLSVGIQIERNRQESPEPTSKKSCPICHGKGRHCNH